MTLPSPTLGDLALRIVVHEAGTETRPSAIAGAVEGACLKLRNDLKDMLGAGGVASLAGRALNLAKRAHPVLAGVAVDAGSTACFTGLEKALEGSEDAASAGSSILAHLLGVLVILLGDELGMQPVRKFWPHLYPRDRGIDK